MSDRPAEQVDVVEEPADHRFVVRLDGTQAGYTEYRSGPEGVRVFFHTEIQPELEGRGLASVLISAALESTRATGLRVVARCPFVRAYVEKHPETYRDLVVSPHL